MNALKRTYPVDLIVFASPVYWPEAAERTATYDSLVRVLPTVVEGLTAGQLRTHLVASEADLQSALHSAKPGLAVFCPISGGVQPLMLEAADFFKRVALLNAYLPDSLPPDLSEEFMHRNAHPACTDFFAHLRLHHKPVRWLRSLRDLGALCRAWQTAQRLRHARLLKVGETEPWVINSTRDPKAFRSRFGLDVVPLESQELYDRVPRTKPARVDELAAEWVAGSQIVTGGVVPEDVKKACAVIAAMEDLLGEYEADGLSMACFAMIGALDTTSCLALSALNDRAETLGACEGDLDSAVTLFALKSFGADFVWMGNPIIYDAPFIELAHCTAPRCACGTKLPYKLMRHHESGKGVAPEVALPGGETVTLARVGAHLTQLARHVGWTERIPKRHACHTQIRVHLPDTQALLDNLLGTHLVLSYGDWSRELDYFAFFTGLEAVPHAMLVPPEASVRGRGAPAATARHE